MISENATTAFPELDLDLIRMKLMHAESGESWSAARAAAVEVEYRRFLYLMKAFPNEQVAPSVDVDTFWHYHILDTAKYAVDCELVFGYFLHHYPYIGLRGGDDAEVHRRSGERMRELYEQTFGAGTASRAVTKQPAYCAAAAESAYCAVTADAGSRAAEQESAYCAVTAKAAYCAAPTASAYCAVAAKAAYCAAQTASAYCAAQTASAYCAVAADADCAAKPASAYCAVAADAAYCAAKPASAYCAVAADAAGGASKPASAYCAAKSASAYCAAQTASNRVSGRAGRAVAAATA